MKKLFVLFIAIIMTIFVIPSVGLSCEMCGDPAHTPMIQTSTGPELCIVSAFNIGGDLRLRYEGQNNNGDYSGLQLYRTRIGFGFSVNDNANFMLGLSSTNQEIDGTIGTTGINLDIATVNYKVNDNLALIGGKNMVSFYQPNGSELMFDDDVRLEGLSASFNRSYNNDLCLASTVGYYNDLLTGGQLTVNLYIMGLDVTAGGGYYDYDGGGSNNQAFMEIGREVFDFPVTLTGDYVWNDRGNSWLAGVEVEDVGPVTVYANYRSVKAGTIHMGLTGVDFVNDGHEVGVEYQFAHNIDIDLNVLTKDFDDENYQVRSDLIFSF